MKGSICVKQLIDHNIFMIIDFNSNPLLPHLMPTSQEEENQILTLLKSKVSPDELQKSLPLIIEIPLKERQGFLNDIETLLKIELKNDEGSPLSFFTALFQLGNQHGRRRKPSISVLDLYISYRNSQCCSFIQNPLNPGNRVDFVN